MFEIKYTKYYPFPHLIKKWYRCWYITLNNTSSDMYISDRLELELWQYVDKLKEFGAVGVSNNSYFGIQRGLYFRSRKKAEETLEWIESVYVMNQLKEKYNE